MNPQFFTGIIELNPKSSVTLLRCIMTIVQIGFGASQRNLESFSKTEPVTQMTPSFLNSIRLCIWTLIL